MSLMIMARTAAIGNPNRCQEPPTRLRMNEGSIKQLAREAFAGIHGGAYPVEPEEPVGGWSSPGSTVFGIPIVVDDSLPFGVIEAEIVYRVGDSPK